MAIIEVNKKKFFFDDDSPTLSPKNVVVKNFG